MVGVIQLARLGEPTYRYYLINIFTDEGLSVDYVGPYNGVGADFNNPINPNPFVVPTEYQDSSHPVFSDQDMAGSTGWKIDNFLQSGELPADSLIENYDPDYVLVHLGTNNLGSRIDTPQQAKDKMGQLIDLIRSGDAKDSTKDTKIYVAQIIPLMDGAYGGGPGEYQLVQDYNALLFDLITLKNQDVGYPDVTIVDMWTGFDYDNMLADGTHPNESGDREMAARWYSAIVTDLNLVATPEPTTIALPGIDLTGQVTLSWGQNTEDNIVGYKIYYGEFKRGLWPEY